MFWLEHPTIRDEVFLSHLFKGLRVNSVRYQQLLNIRLSALNPKEKVANLLEHLHRYSWTYHLTQLKEALEDLFSSEMDIKVNGLSELRESLFRKARQIRVEDAELNRQRHESFLQSI
jgi:hypothetical protein